MRNERSALYNFESESFQRRNGADARRLFFLPATRFFLVDRRTMLALADRYARLLENQGAIARRADVHRHLDVGADREMLFNHARWQLAMVHRVIRRVGGEPTAVRLLGSAQGLLVAMGLLTVEQTWRDNTEWLDGASVRAFDAAMDDLASASSPLRP
jgi:hypothetical protein